MKTFSFEEIGNLTVTFEADSSLREGEVVKIVGKKAFSCMDGERFDGVASKPVDGMVSVQMRGFATVSYENSVSSGAGLVADGMGGIKTGDGANSVVLVDTDSQSKTALIFM